MIDCYLVTSEEGNVVEQSQIDRLMKSNPKLLLLCLKAEATARLEQHQQAQADEWEKIKRRREQKKNDKLWSV